jgi:hypothetical protein
VFTCPRTNFRMGARGEERCAAQNRLQRVHPSGSVSCSAQKPQSHRAAACLTYGRDNAKDADDLGFVMPSVRTCHLHTPHSPPSLAQCRQYLQFLQALQGSLPVHVAAENTSSGIRVRRVSDRNKRETNDMILFVVTRRLSFHGLESALTEDEPHPSN